MQYGVTCDQNGTLDKMQKRWPFENLFENYCKEAV